MIPENPNSINKSPSSDEFESPQKSFEEAYNEVFADAIKAEEAKRARDVDSELDHLLEIQGKEWALESQDREMFLRIYAKGESVTFDEMRKYEHSITSIDENNLSDQEKVKLGARLSMMAYLVKEFLMKHKVKVLDGKP